MRQPNAITIGNFDGVHRGHLQLVNTARRCVGSHGRVVVLSFDPNPLTVLAPEKSPPRLTTWPRRETLLLQAGADQVIPLRPTPDFLNQSPEDFLARLASEHHPDFIIEGPDFHFGRRRAGTIQTLRDHESNFNFKTVVIEPVSAALSDQSIVTVSSSMIRRLLLLGRVDDARRLLGRPYELHAAVVSGDRRGRTIGAPTVNLGNVDCLLPADGIYAGLAARPDDSTFPAAISIGTKPTFGDHPRTCEAHLIGYDGPLDDYDWPVRLAFHHWLRDQLTYSNVDLLIDQLHRDIHRSQQLIQLPSPLTACH